MVLNDNTTSGTPCDGDMFQACYMIHSPDPVKYLLPPNLKDKRRDYFTNRWIMHPPLLLT
jgi:hypothetical protein